VTRYAGDWPAYTYRRPDKTVYAQPNSKTGKRLLARRKLKHTTYQQRAVMDAFRLCAWNWNDYLDDEDREQWCSDAAGGAHYVRNGCLLYLNGFAHFVRSQLPQQYSEPDTIDIPGPNYHTFGGLYLAQASWNESTGQALLQWDNHDNVKNEDGTLLIVHQVNPTPPIWAPHRGGSTFDVHDAPASAAIIETVSPWPTDNDPTLWVTPCYEATPEVDMWFYARWCWGATHAGALALAYTAPFPPTVGNMTGTGDPDPNGEYIADGETNGKPAYIHRDEYWKIWWYPGYTGYFITPHDGFPLGPSWGNFSGNVEGNYWAWSETSGTPVFTLT